MRAAQEQLQLTQILLQELLQLAWLRHGDGVAFHA
jgi:hypothetical protein